MLELGEGLPLGLELRVGLAFVNGLAVCRANRCLRVHCGRDGLLSGLAQSVEAIFGRDGLVLG